MDPPRQLWVSSPAQHQHHHPSPQVPPIILVNYFHTSEAPIRRTPHPPRDTPPPPPPIPAPLFAGKRKKKKRSSSSVADVEKAIQKFVSKQAKPIGAAYTYNWAMWSGFGCNACLRCTAGWFLCLFAIFCCLVILWIFGVLWICAFSDNFCEVRS